MLKRAFEKATGIDILSDGWGLLLLLTFVFGVVGYVLLIGSLITHDPSFTPYKWLILKTLAVMWGGGYILSAFSGAEDEYERRWALFLGTIAFPTFLPLTLLVIAGRLLWKVLFGFQTVLLRLQGLATGDAINKYKNWRKQVAADKFIKQQQQMRIMAGAYRSPSAHCLECGQELPNEYEETINKEIVK